MRPNGIGPILLPVIKVERVFVEDKSPPKDMITVPNPEKALVNESVPAHAVSKESHDLDAVSVLRELVKDVRLIDLKRGDRKRQVFDLWKNIDGEMFNLSGNINENKGKGITITVLHHSLDPISFEGIPLVLEPRHKAGSSVEVQLQPSIRVDGEYRASFSRLSPRINTYSLRVGS